MKMILKRLLVAGRNKNGVRKQKTGGNPMAMAEILNSCVDLLCLVWRFERSVSCHLTKYNHNAN